MNLYDKVREIVASHQVSPNYPPSNLPKAFTYSGEEYGIELKENKNGVWSTWEVLLYSNGKHIATLQDKSISGRTSVNWYSYNL